MARISVKGEYFEWMYDMVCRDRFSKSNSYRALLKYLHSEPFVYILKKDDDRYCDGIALRRRFALSNTKYDYNYITDCLGDDLCTVLEMILALAIRCEEGIMDNPALGDRTAQWFWKMIVNLGLGGMIDDRFDEKEAEKILETFMYREHSPDGHGGLFVIRGCKHDLRDVEIWTQMTWFLDTIV